MLTRRSITARIPALRPLRPPADISLRSKPRLFTQNSQLLLIARHVSRPHLPYLAQPNFRILPSSNGATQQSARFLTIETRQRVREQVWQATKWTALIWVFLTLGSITWFGITMEIDERAQPTPEEWRWRARQSLRAARTLMSTEHVDTVGYVNWGHVYMNLIKALRVLEEPTKDSKGQISSTSGDMGGETSSAGYDVTSKSWPWRAGYVEVVMGLAIAAEHLDDMVLDTTRKQLFPKSVMIGPSNPDPRPVPPYMDAAPLEQNCTAPCPKPDSFYLRILDGKGYTTKQRLDAAVAYAEWLRYTGQLERADELYHQNVDIAKTALTHITAGGEVIDQSCVIKSTNAGEGSASENLLRAATDLAVHNARNGDVSSALPILLSVLRARKTAPVLRNPTTKTSASDRQTVWSIARRLLQQSSFPPEPPSGDEPFARSSAEPDCDESELMLYVGEILFAISSSLQEGLSWTRQAVEIADTFCQRDAATKSAYPEDIQKKCRECLVTGAANWETMLRRIMEQLEVTPASPKSWFSFGGAVAKSSPTIDELDAELRNVVTLRSRLLSEGIENQVARARTSNPSGVWLG